MTFSAVNARRQSVGVFVSKVKVGGGAPARKDGKNSRVHCRLDRLILHGATGKPDIFAQRLMHSWCLPISALGSR